MYIKKRTPSVTPDLPIAVDTERRGVGKVESASGGSLRGTVGAAKLRWFSFKKLISQGVGGTRGLRFEYQSK